MQSQRRGREERRAAAAAATHGGALRERRQQGGQVEELHEQLQPALHVAVPAGAAQRLRRHHALPVACAW